MMFERERLLATLSELGITPRTDIFGQLSELYGEAERHYHTHKHIAECLEALDRSCERVERPAEVETAIWFHDAIYDTRRGDNEEQSAELAKRFLTVEGVADGCVERIVLMILATKSHQANDGDTRLLVDIDLGILGQPPDVFGRYDQAIRREYAWVPEDQYRRGRAAVLGAFLDRPRIYSTSEFHDAYEAQARQNIETRLKTLIG
jgi:predicted metal-dependent HD superfamily phosphohydrolase